MPKGSLMLDDDHTELVHDLCKPGRDINDSLTPHDAHLIHMVLGICGEAGELLDAVKKATIYRKELDRENIVEELGDLEFYLRGLRESLGITREDTLKHNINKLRKRYDKKYSDTAAIHRADKRSAAQPQILRDNLQDKDLPDISEPTHPDQRP